MINFISNYRKVFFFIIDAVILVFTVYLSFFLRFEGKIPAEQIHNLRNLIILALIFGLPIFYWQRLYHFTWSFVGLKELSQIIKAVTITSLLIGTSLFILRDFPQFSGFPRSVILINYFFTLLFISSLRISKRIFRETIKLTKKIGKKVLIVGAGEAGEELARSILKNLQYSLVGFVDDDKNKQNILIHGIPVLGKRADIPKIVERFAIEEIIIAMPSVAPQIIQETLEICRRAKIQKIKILPSFQEIINEKITLSHIRDITIEDLLGREKIEIDTAYIKKFLENKKVLITGAAGSIGSYLSKQVLKFQPSLLIALDQDETGLFYLANDLEREFPKEKKSFEIADICDEKGINWLFEKIKPEIVFHAAAYKHVPMMEFHPREAVKNNIFGTLIVAQAAIKCKTEKFIFISTDKAINPTSVMGATKRVGEMICQWLNKKNKTKFCAVRFGNVLDSQGNVIKIFEEQIKRGGPIEITHPEMKRYFMVTSEACLLVMQAAALAQGGEVFVLDMGQPIKILDLAKAMIRLAGYQPDVEIPIIFTKPRPGEKLFEEILTETEIPTQYDKIFIAKLANFDEKKLLTGLEGLKTILDQMNNDAIIKKLKEIIPTYQNNF